MRSGVEERASKNDLLDGKRKRAIEREEDEHVSVLFPNKRGKWSTMAGGKKATIKKPSFRIEERVMRSGRHHRRG
jgi:hypothetical protein